MRCWIVGEKEGARGVLFTIFLSWLVSLESVYPRGRKKRYLHIFANQQ